jgi:hypothetical protein
LTVWHILAKKGARDLDRRNGCDAREDGPYDARGENYAHCDADGARSGDPGVRVGLDLLVEARWE